MYLHRLPTRPDRGWAVQGCRKLLAFAVLALACQPQAKSLAKSLARSQPTTKPDLPQDNPANSPKVHRSIVTIQVEVPEYSPADIETLVTAPLESALATIDGISGLRSQTSLGEVNLELELSPGQNLDATMILVREQLAKLAEQLPEQALAPVIRSSSQAHEPVATIALTGDLAIDQLVALGQRLQRQLLRAPGITSARLCAPSRELRIDLDAAKLRAYALKLDELTTAIEHTLAVPSTPGPKPVKLADTVVKVSNAGPVQLGDIATITDALTRVECQARLGGRAAVTVSLWSADDADQAAWREVVHQQTSALPGSVQIQTYHRTQTGWLDVHLPAGTPLPQAEAEIANLTQLQGVSLVAYAANEFRVRVTVLPASDELLAKLRHEIQQRPGLTLRAQSIAGKPDPRAVQVHLTGPDVAQLQQLANAAAHLLRTDEEVESVRVVGPGQSPEIEVEIDRARLAQLGLTHGEVMQWIRATNYGPGHKPGRGLELGTRTSPDGAYPVVLTIDSGHPQPGEQALLELTVAGPAGPVPLRSFATIRMTRSLSTIEHQDGRRSVTVALRRHGPEPISKRLRTHLASNLELPPGYSLVWETPPS